MNTQDVRRANLRALADQWGGVNSLARKLGYANGSFLVQMCGPHPIREVSERTARRIEGKLGLPPGWLETSDHAAVPADVDIVAVIRDVTQALLDAKVVATNAKFAEIVVLALSHTKATGKPDPDFIRAIVGLLK